MGEKKCFVPCAESAQKGKNVYLSEDKNLTLDHHKM